MSSTPPVFERRPGQTLWLQVAEALNAEISAGLHSSGAQLPTEPEMMRRFGVSRFTVRQAMAHLQSIGVVRVEQGRGTFVAAPALDYDISRRTQYSRNLSDQGIEPGNEALLTEIIPAAPAVSEALGLTPGALVVHRRGVGTADGTPLEVADTYLPEIRFPDFARIRAGQTSLTDTLAAFGVEHYTRAWTTIGARASNSDEAALLQIVPGASVLVTTKLDVDQTGIPIVYAETVWNAELVRFRFGDDTARHNGAG